MIIVIAPEDTRPAETETVNQLFDLGLDLFHIRKYAFSDNEMRDYVEGISSSHQSRLVLHSHYHLAEQFGINRLHFRESDRIKNKHLPYADCFILSTSTHSIQEFNALSEVWKYAFLSPAFPSISKKGYGLENSILEDIPLKTNTSVKLIALGGIHEHNLIETRIAGADGTALLGSIWQNENALNTFINCKKTDLLF